MFDGKQFCSGEKIRRPSIPQCQSARYDNSDSIVVLDIDFREHRSRGWKAIIIKFTDLRFFPLCMVASAGGPPSISENNLTDILNQQEFNFVGEASTNVALYLALFLRLIKMITHK